MLVLAGCAGRPVREAPRPAVAPSTTRSGGGEHEGRVYEVSSEDSLLTLLVFRGGPLAGAGHNHVIASHAMTGTAWVPEDLGRASFEVRVPVAELTIDEPDLRALEGADFSAPVPASAREGTRKNMLGASLLDGARFPEVVLRSQSVERGSEGLLAKVSVEIRGLTRTITVPMRYESRGNEIRVQGQFALKQTDLGLTPFSFLGGALRVEDEMRVKFSIVARRE
jgi:polyisoprenoid-binding protein YceI